MSTVREIWRIGVALMLGPTCVEATWRHLAGLVS